jgi:acyl dehydratase
MSRRWQDLHEGLGPEPLEIGPITRTDSVRYQGASGDMNPIHHDDEFARAAGFSAPVTVGMFQAGVMHAWLAAWLGPENVRRASMRWKEPVFPGDRLTFTAAIAKKYELDGERRVDVELWCKKQTGAVAVTGSATYVVRS